MAGQQRTSRRGGGRRSGTTIVVGIAIGVLLGLAAALGVALYINKGPNPFVDRTSAKPRPAPEAARPGPKQPRTAIPEPVTGTQPSDTAGKGELPLEYHTVLEGASGARRPQLPPETSRGTTVYYLQIAALSNAADADNLKARLALQGIEARIQTIQREDKMLHRVRVGPFPSVEEADRARARLKQNQIEATRVQELDRSPGP
jgi:cell division protein FtsN